MDRDKPHDQFVISVSFCAFKHEQIHLSPNKCSIFGQIWSISIYIHFDWSIRIPFGALYLHGDACSHICQNFWVSFCLDLSFPELHSCWVSSILSRTLLQTMQMTLITSLEKSTWAKGWDVLPWNYFFPLSPLLSKWPRLHRAWVIRQRRGMSLYECLRSGGQLVLSFVVLPMHAGGSRRLLGMTSKPQ